MYENVYEDAGMECFKLTQKPPLYRKFYFLVGTTVWDLGQRSQIFEAWDRHLECRDDSLTKQEGGLPFSKWRDDDLAFQSWPRLVRVFKLVLNKHLTLRVRVLANFYRSVWLIDFPRLPFGFSD
ncbi:unnamed protein product [Sphenostylis stenocarpa]|uniref:Uncharacterized protein n=1 Tax=Sphenostylis stenocarpa TaxID=92480 RepID=A0AA86SPZ5_9FABA|nr:unnamed protein product [Sphenostylis stenocarpa]